MKLVAAIFLLGAAGNGFAHASDLRGREFIGYGSFESFATNNSPGSEAMVLVSPVVQSQIRFDEAIVSWTAKAGPDAFLTVEARALYDEFSTKYYTLGIWSPDPSRHPRRSVANQDDPNGGVSTDILKLK